MTYTLRSDGYVIRDADGTIIPPEGDANDRLIYLAWIEAGNEPAPAPPPPPIIPDVISDRQCFQWLAMMGKITQDEALAAVTVGALPKAVSDGIAALPADQQFGARMLLCGATSFERLHPMVPVFLAFFSLNGTTDRDALWSAASAL